MFGSGILDLLLGLIFIYFIMSLISSAIREMAANALDLRYAHLKDWFENIFRDMESGEKSTMFKSFGEQIMNHHLIAGLTTKKKKPSYIPDNIFSTVVFDLFANDWNKDGKMGTYDFASLKKAIEKSDVLKPELKRILVQFANESDNIVHFRTRVETWFNQAMTEASGTYRQRTHAWLILIALGVTMALNVDSISVAKYLYQNPEAREQLAEQAVAATENPEYIQAVAEIRDTTQVDNSQLSGDSIIAKINNGLEEVKEQAALLKSSTLPIGWSEKESVWSQLASNFSLSMLFGWMMTAFAVSLGAPFWFDMLNKLSSIRSSSVPPKENTPETRERYNVPKTGEN